MRVRSLHRLEVGPLRMLLLRFGGMEAEGGVAQEAQCNDDIQPVIIIKFFTAAVQLRPTPAPIVNIPQLKFCQTFL